MARFERLWNKTISDTFLGGIYLLLFSAFIGLAWKGIKWLWDNNMWTQASGLIPWLQSSVSIPIWAYICWVLYSALALGLLSIPITRWVRRSTTSWLAARRGRQEAERIAQLEAWYASRGGPLGKAPGNEEKYSIARNASDLTSTPAAPSSNRISGADLVNLVSAVSGLGKSIRTFIHGAEVTETPNATIVTVGPKNDEKPPAIEVPEKELTARQTVLRDRMLGRLPPLPGLPKPSESMRRDDFIRWLRWKRLLAVLAQSASPITAEEAATDFAMAEQLYAGNWLADLEQCGLVTRTIAPGKPDSFSITDNGTAWMAT